MFDWKAAEELVAMWMREHVHPGARLTGAGADEGIDVQAPGFAAQVKAYTNRPLGRPEVQSIAGAVAGSNDVPVLFSMSGFNENAIMFAERAGVALFAFHPDGRVRADNDLAKQVGSNRRLAAPSAASVEQKFSKWGPVNVPGASEHTNGCFYSFATVVVLMWVFIIVGFALLLWAT